MTKNPPPPAEASDLEVKPFLEHLEDLRATLLRMAGVFALAFAAAVPLAPRVFRLLRRPLERATGSAEPFLRSLEVGGGFTLAMRISFWSALIFSAPLLVYFLARFISPGLTVRERRIAAGALFAAATLFIAGVALGYFLTLPIAVRVMLSLHQWMGVRAEWTVASYMVFALQLLLAFGLAFELPVVLVALGRLGVLTAAQLRFYRRHAIIALLVLAALLTPNDVFTQMAMALPLIALYEACVWIIAAGERRDDP